MRRLHLFELTDQTWCPDVLRDGMTDYLRFVTEVFRVFEPALEVLKRGLAASGGAAVIDLASGGGGAWGALAAPLATDLPGLRVTLTDLYPNQLAGERLVARHPGVLRYELEPVDARAVPARLSGLRTQFLSIHHFRPPDVERILANAVEAGAPIALFEAQRRDLRHVLQLACSPLLVLALTPFIRPARLDRLLLTYLLPLIPLGVGFDGAVSALRTYTPAELLRIAASADASDAFTWEAGELPGGPTVVQYLLGTPR